MKSIWLIKQFYLTITFSEFYFVMLFKEFEISKRFPLVEVDFSWQALDLTRNRGFTHSLFQFKFKSGCTLDIKLHRPRYILLLVLLFNYKRIVKARAHISHIQLKNEKIEKVLYKNKQCIKVNLCVQFILCSKTTLSDKKTFIVYKITIFSLYIEVLTMNGLFQRIMYRTEKLHTPYKLFSVKMAVFLKKRLVKTIVVLYPGLNSTVLYSNALLGKVMLDRWMTIESEINRTVWKTIEQEYTGISF